MKNIFLIGDSIRLGYEATVVRELEENCKVFSSPDNARFTTYTMRYVHEWMKDAPSIDLVHWNNGLWDSCHWNGDPISLVSLDSYVQNLLRIYGYIRRLCPNAKIIFALSTAVDAQHPRILNRELDAMNKAAAKTLDGLVDGFDDLSSIVKANPGFIRTTDHVHMTDIGYEELGKAVAQCIRKFL